MEAATDIYATIIFFPVRLLGTLSKYGYRLNNIFVTQKDIGIASFESETVIFN